jgi:SNF2-related domain/Helicase conserved C-terminal domain
MMDIFKIFRKAKTEGSSKHLLHSTYDNDGVTIELDVPLPSPDTQCLMDALDDCSRNETVLGGYLLQLVIEGQATLTSTSIKISWETIYNILSDVQFSGLIDSLGLPVPCRWCPILDCRGTLTDSNFTVFIKGWADGDRQLSTDPKILGAVVESSEAMYLLPKSSWELISTLSKPNKPPSTTRSQHDNELYWGEVRAIATEAGALYASRYLEHTVVLTPHSLQLGLTRDKTSFGSVYTVNPGFRDAPPDWLGAFDKFASVQPHYDLNGANGRTRVIITEPVKKILEVIKTDMPGRRVAGAKAEKFIKNPTSFLGEETATAIDLKDFEENRGTISPLETSFHVRGFYDQGRVIGAVIEITEIFANEATKSYEERISQLKILDELLHAIGKSVSQEREWHPWREYDLTLDASTPIHLEKMTQLRDLWEHQSDAPISFEDLFELSGYSERIEGVGIQRTVYVPVLKKDPSNDESGWVDPNNLTPLLRIVTEDNPEGVIVPVTEKWANAFEQKVAAGEADGVELIHDPYLPTPLGTLQARLLLEGIRALLKYKDKIKNADPSPPSEEKLPKETLLLKTNFAKLDYQEQRSNLLSLPDDYEARIPKSLKPSVELKEHQLYGVRWFQHLVSKSPTDCRGALLADDMGLGKTIQLLTVLGTFYEENPTAPPSIVFAPKSLLENWSNEVHKFFTPKFPKTRILYGRELSRLKQPQFLIDQQLRGAGITDLLKPGWIEDVKIFFTSYEVLTSYQFSLAKQKLSFVICDEAQRIKTPGTMVTLAAKKLNAQFRVACTGTPVENSLTDLWCLFDFIQPGLLGTLDKFTEAYRRPIECNSDELVGSLGRLQALIRPQILRRTKEHIRKELKGRYYAIKPSGTNELSFKPREELGDSDRLEIPMCDYQVLLYKGGLQKLQDAALADDKKRRATLSFGALHLMKAVCAEPYCLPGSKFTPDSKGIDAHLENSPKLKWVMDQLKQIQQKGEKAIVFTELREAQLSLYFFLREIFSIKPFIINGDSEKRQEYIDRFSASEGFDVIILSTLAAGAGLNVTAANHVFHFTRAWNPAKENQATDRAYRIGQERDVFVYCPTMVSDFPTFEFRLDQLMRRKASLADSTLDSDVMTAMLNGSGGDFTIKEFFSSTTP